MHGDVHPLKDKVKATSLSPRRFPGKVGIDIPLSIQVDFQWKEQLNRAFAAKAPGKQAPNDLG